LIRSAYPCRVLARTLTPARWILSTLCVTALIVVAAACVTLPRPYTSAIEPLPQALRDRMTGVTWQPGCPVGLDDLRLLTVTYLDDAGAAQDGQLVVHQDAASALERVFRKIYESRFAVHRIALADEVGGNDDELGRQNITSAFNCRRVSGSTTWSQHAYGRAVDINPCVNPWVRSNGTVQLAECAHYRDRNRTDVPGMVKRGDVVVQAFAAEGWGWGGAWRSSKDYQHFSANGR
jgi:hypothetical protein